ncbi:MAG: 3'-5' exonuclease [Paludibacteraceae bacterium]
MYQATIDKEYIATLPIVQPNGRIVVVKSRKEADAAVTALMHENIIGFDTETRPSFSAHTHYNISLLQLATADTCFLFRLQFIGTHQGLKQILESDDILKVGLSIKDDFHALRAWMPLTPRNFIELQNLAEQFGIAEKSLQKMYAIIFDKKISKAQRLSNWDTPILTPQQKTYAAIDAWACRDIFIALQTQH